MLTEDKVFDKTDFTKHPLAAGDYEYCTFHHCHFSETDLSDMRFVECEFTHCNLSLVKLVNTAFRDVRFTGCKLTGLHWDDCEPFGVTVSFSDCNLNHSLFSGVKMKNTVCSNSSLQEVDFSGADLSSSCFSHCDFTHAVFDATNLEKADFRTSYNYHINPAHNRIKKAKFSLSAVAGLLSSFGVEVDSTS